MRVLGSCSALALALVVGGGALAQTPAQMEQAAPSAVAPSFTPPSFAAPSLARPPSGAPGAAAPSGVPGEEISVPAEAAQKLKPPADFLTDCSRLPAGAVKEVPAEMARWSTLYCTKYGQLFSSNDKYFSAFPGTGLRGAFLAGELSGRAGNRGAKAYFKKITYLPLAPEAAAKLEAGLQDKERQLLKDKPLFRVDLTLDNNQTYSMVVIAPEQDPFWVIPIVGNKLNRTGFYVASLDYVNRKR
jgi:hypothetical protein